MKGNRPAPAGGHPGIRIRGRRADRRGLTEERVSCRARRETCSRGAMNGSETARSGCRGYALNVYPQDYTERRDCVAGSDDGGAAMMVGVAILPYRLSRYGVNRHPAASCQHHPPKGQLPALLLQITRPSSTPRNRHRVASMPSFMSWTDDSHQTGSCRSTK